MSRIAVLAASVLTGALLLGELIACRPAPPAGGEAGATLLPDPEGPITLVVCQVSTARRSAVANAALVAGVINALPLRTRILVLTNDLESLRVGSDPHPGRVQLVELPEEASFSIWPQDPFLVSRDAGGDYRLIVPGSFRRYDDGLMAAAVERATGWPTVQTDLAFEGGNIVSDAEHVFIGAETIAHSTVAAGSRQDEVVRKFEDLLGLRVKVIGSSPQPMRHIDMVLTPLGERRILVADPVWGARLARSALEGEPERVRDFERSCEALFGGGSTEGGPPAGQGATLAPPPVVGRTAAAAAFSDSLSGWLDGIARDLERELGYTVLRVPWLGMPPEGTGAGVEGEAGGGPSGAGYPILTYNNVLLERLPQGGLVYLPRYGFDALDEAAAEVWREAGFQVRPVSNLTLSAMFGGSLRCCAKVLARGQAGPEER